MSDNVIMFPGCLQEDDEQIPEYEKEFLADCSDWAFRFAWFARTAYQAQDCDDLIMHWQTFQKIMQEEIMYLRKNQKKERN